MATATQSSNGHARVPVAVNNQPTYCPARAPYRLINVFEQVRKSMDPEELKTLAESIRSRGLFSPPLVTFFERTQMLEYLALLNELWGTNYTIRDLKTWRYKGKTIYPVLIAGHRRYAACGILLSEAEQLPSCLAYDGGEAHLEIRLGENLDPFEALQCQFQENTYVPPPVTEEAHAYDNLYRLLNHAGNGVTLRELAGMVGRGEKKVRAALRFCRLPPEIQEAVIEGILSYGVAIELSRLQDQGCTVSDCHHWMMIFAMTRPTVGAARKKISRFLEQRERAKQGQDLLQLMEETSEEESRRAALRQLISLQTFQALLAHHGFLKAVTYLRDKGILDTSTTACRDPRVVQGLRTVFEDLRGLMPDLDRVLSQDELLQAEHLLEMGETLVTRSLGRS